tara:strand:+ start:319 stop:486 length:168 start_codon:yes stop_codon:yes gene_type:complete
MAKIVSDAIVIEISRIAKEDQQLETVITDEVTTTLEQVVQQLVGDAAVVEVKTGQ